MKGKELRLLLAGGVVLFFVSIAAAQTCVQAPANLTGWWPGDGNTNDIVGGRNAVLRGNATFGPGLVGEGFLLDGDGDFVEVPNDPAFNVGTGDFTVDLWVNFNTTDGEQVLVEKWIQRFSEQPSEGWSFTKLDGNILHMALVSRDGSVELVYSEVLTIPVGTWNHFAARRQSGKITLFMNGAPVASGQFSGNLDSASSLKFGHRGNPSDTPGSEDDRQFFLNGRIDEVELFVGRALSDAEIQAIFNAGSAGKCKGVPFKAFTADVTIKMEPQPNQQTFKLNSKFATGSESDGIDPANETVSIQIGALSITLPAGSFRPLGGNFSFDGIIAGVRLQVKIIEMNGRGFQFIAKGRNANLSGTKIPVTVGISIGDDNGNVTLKNTLVIAGSHPMKLPIADDGELPQ